MMWLMGSIMKYMDGMGHVYNVPKEQLAEFERRRGVLLRISIVVQIMIILAIIIIGFLR